MRAHAALLSEQKKSNYAGIWKASFTVDGLDEHVYGKGRIMSIDHTEATDGSRATIILDNSDNTFTSLLLKGYEMRLSYGMTIGGSDIYSTCAPLVVVAQQNISREGSLIAVLEAIGVEELLTWDLYGNPAITEPYVYASDQTVKDILISLLSTLQNQWLDYDVVFDSEDALIDVFTPGAQFKVSPGDNRWDKVQEVLSYTGCVMRWEEDATATEGRMGKFHVLVPKVDPALNYDYEYTLTSGDHKFFAKSYRQRLFFPNFVNVYNLRTGATTYTGGASDNTEFGLRPVYWFYEIDVASNAQAEDVAEALLLHAKLDNQTGFANVPMNVLQELWDYVAITDSRDSTTKTGNVQSINRKCNALKNTWSMSLAFGTRAAQIAAGLAEQQR